ncbi:MAG TPA: FHA domain-containing protein, partial [Gemmatimonadaceae bacterium]|nr:FHA domain-containing protein [Gemmatimonadaceae bacterium]
PSAPAAPAPAPAAPVAASAPSPRPAPPPLSEEPPTVPTAAPEPKVPAAAAASAAPAPPADRRPVLATLELLNEGLTKGLKLEIRGALTHIGRGEHNDVVLADDSVSDSHAKLQHRDGGWYLVDVGSTNGTFVGGTRISAERRLDGSPDVRFGGVKARFHPAAAAAGAAGGTRQVSAVSRPQPASAAAAPVAKSGVPVWVWVLLALVVAAGAVIFFRMKA